MIPSLFSVRSPAASPNAVFLSFQPRYLLTSEARVHSLSQWRNRNHERQSIDAHIIIISSGFNITHRRCSNRHHQQQQQEHRLQSFITTYQGLGGLHLRSDNPAGRWRRTDTINQNFWSRSPLTFLQWSIWLTSTDVNGGGFPHQTLSRSSFSNRQKKMKGTNWTLSRR